MQSTLTAATKINREIHVELPASAMKKDDSRSVFVVGLNNLE